MPKQTFAERMARRASRGSGESSILIRLFKYNPDFPKRSERIVRSSNGRTTDSDSVYLGSNPSLPAKQKRPPCGAFFVLAVRDSDRTRRVRQNRRERFWTAAGTGRTILVSQPQKSFSGSQRDSEDKKPRVNAGFFVPATAAISAPATNPTPKAIASSATTA